MLMLYLIEIPYQTTKQLLTTVKVFFAFPVCREISQLVELYAHYLNHSYPIPQVRSCSYKIRKFKFIGLDNLALYLSKLLPG